MIFILDDDAGVRDSLRLLLECEGLETREFASCPEFLDADGAESDCLILDVHLPGMSGIELLETMRRRGDMLPVIVISGRIDAMTRNRARAAGALAVVEKPYQVEEVLDLVRRAMGRGYRSAGLGRALRRPQIRQNNRSATTARKARSPTFLAASLHDIPRAAAAAPTSLDFPPADISRGGLA